MELVVDFLYRTLSPRTSIQDHKCLPVGNFGLSYPNRWYTSGSKERSMSPSVPGIGNLRPPYLSKTFIWEVDTVLGCLKELKDDNDISDKDLTFKTVVLMALTAIKRYTVYSR